MIILVGADIHILSTGGVGVGVGDGGGSSIDGSCHGRVGGDGRAGRINSVISHAERI